MMEVSGLDSSGENSLNKGIRKSMGVITHMCVHACICAYLVLVTSL